MEQAVAGQPLSRPYLGISFVSIDRAARRRAKARRRRRARSSAAIDASGNPTGGVVRPARPADEAGIKDGDIIVTSTARPSTSEHPLDATLSQFAPGDTVPVEVLRDGKTVTLQVTLGTRPANL